MIKFSSLFSSSSGNCTYIGNENGGVLIDAGVSAKKITEALKSIDTEPENISAIFITHEHSDHISGVRVFASKHNIPVYATEGTLRGMDEAGVFRSPVDAYILPDVPVEAGDFSVKPFPISHDANSPCGYTVTAPSGVKISVATDMGVVTEAVRSAVIGSKLVLLESNHDIPMLQCGAYPYQLKQRILSSHGHLNNEDSSVFATELLATGTTEFVLGHLSKENNMPALAYQTTLAALTSAGAELNKDFSLYVAGPDKQITIELQE